MAKAKPKKTDKLKTPTKPADSMDALFSGIDAELVTIRPEVWLPTGHPHFDKLLGGGYPRGRFIELWGVPTAGKSTIALQQAVHFANEGHPVFFLDYEKALTDRLIDSVGATLHVKNHQIIVLKPSTFRDFDNIFTKYISKVPKSMKRPIVFVDSVASIQASNYEEMDVESNDIGTDSRYLTRLVKKYSNTCYAQDITIVWLNQVRANIQTRFGSANAPKEKPYGGKAYEHFLDIRVKISIKGKIPKEQECYPGQFLVLECSKNKFRTTYQKYELPLVWGMGLSIPRYLHAQLSNLKKVKAPGGNYEVKIPGMEVEKFTNRGEYYDWLYTNAESITAYIDGRDH